MVAMQNFQPLISIVSFASMLVAHSFVARRFPPHIDEPISWLFILLAGMLVSEFRPACVDG